MHSRLDSHELPVIFTTTTTNNNWALAYSVYRRTVKSHAAINFDIAKNCARPFRRRRCEWILKSCQHFLRWGVDFDWARSVASQRVCVCARGVCARQWQPPPPLATWHIRLFPTTINYFRNRNRYLRAHFIYVKSHGTYMRSTLAYFSPLLPRLLRQNRIFSFFFALIRSPLCLCSRSLSNVKLNYSNAVTNVRCHFFRWVLLGGCRHRESPC